MLYNSSINFDVMIDITTRCNAGCPQCHRTDLNGLKKQSWLPNISWDLKTFKKAYPENVIKRLRVADFCGTWGDPIVNNNIIDMVKYIRDTNNETKININTNGSMRNDKFWWNLGVAGDKNLMVVFAIEGINQKMHKVYRQNTYLEKILNNMNILSNTKAKINTLTLIWKHNEDYLDEIEKLCVEHGSSTCKVKITDRFGNTKELKFTKTDGTKEVLRKTGETFEDKDELIVLNRRRFVRKKKYMGTTDKKLIEKIRKSKQVMKIVCEWGEKNKVVVNPDGQVLPCCFFSNPHFYNKQVPEVRKWFIEHPVMQEYQKYEKELNVFNSNLIDILKHKWFQSTLQDSWSKTKPVYQCEKFCGKCNKFGNIDSGFLAAYERKRTL